MNDQAVGGVIRNLRRRLRLRQTDLARRCGLAQATISRVERGHLDTLSLRALRRILATLDAGLYVTARWRGGDLERLLDEGHAHLVGAIVAQLTRHGWKVAIEVTYSHFGERGSIDVLGLHPIAQAILVVEAKTELTSLEATLRSLDAKCRLAPMLAAERSGAAVPALVSRALVLTDTATNRRRVARSGSTLASALPDRSRRVRGWLRAPQGRLHGLWFLSAIPAGVVIQARPTPKRIRRHLDSGSAGAEPPIHAQLAGPRPPGQDAWRPPSDMSPPVAT